MLRYFISAVVGYLLGSLSFAVIVSKTKFKKDIRNYGSNNAGMTNTARTFGKKAAAVVFLIYLCDTTVKSKEELQRMTDLPILGEIPSLK